MEKQPLFATTQSFFVPLHTTRPFLSRWSQDGIFTSLCMKNNPLTVFLGLILLLMSCGSDRNNTTEVPSTDTIPMLTQLQSCARLYTTEYQIHTIVTHSDTTHVNGSGLLSGLRISLPMSSRHVAIPIDATIKGYVDMANLSEDNIKKSGEKITVVLPDPKIMLTATKVDHKQTKQFVKIFGRNFSDAELSAFERQGRDSIIHTLPQSGIIQNARINAARILIPLLQQMGYDEKNITITFRKEFTEADLQRMIANTTTQEKRS